MNFLSNIHFFRQRYLHNGCGDIFDENVDSKKKDIYKEE